MSLVVNEKISDTMQKYVRQFASFFGCSEKTAHLFIQTRGQELQRAQRTLGSIFAESFIGMTTTQIATFIKGLDPYKLNIARKMQDLGILKDNYNNLNSVALQNFVLKADKNSQNPFKTTSIFSNKFNQNVQTACFA